MISSQDAATELPALSKTMNSWLIPTKTDADVERAWDAGLSVEQVCNPVVTKPSKKELEIYGIDADFMMTIASSEIKGLIAGEADRVYADRSQAKVPI